MFVPMRHRRRTRHSAVTLVAGLVAAAIAGAGSLTRHGGNPVPRSLLWIAAGAVVAALLFKLMRHAMSPDETPEDSPMDENTEPGENRQRRRLLLLAVIAGLLALGLALALTPRAAQTQEAPTQSAFVITRGADTIVVERITRSRSSIAGDLLMKGQARMLFTAELAAGPFVPSLSFKAWGAGASLESPPVQSGTLLMTADSSLITVQTPAGERKLAKAISSRPLPILNNDFALIELAIARARAESRAQGGSTATVPMFALSGGVQLDCVVEFIGADTAVFRVAGQENRFGIDGGGNITGGIVVGQNLVITRVNGAAATKISLGRPDYGAPAGAPYGAEDVTVQTPAGHVLTGTLTVPTGATGKVPAVVTITGSGAQDRDEYIFLVPGYRIFRQVADTLGRRGIAVLRLDDRGINGSGGDVQQATTADFADDIRAGVAFLRARAEIDGARIALVGHSEGGVIAPMVAATDPKLAGIVLMAGTAYTGKRIIDFQLRNGVMSAEAIPAAAKDSALKATVAQFDSTTAKVPWMAWFLTYDPMVTARTVKSTPVFIMQGGTDQQVTPDQAPVLERAFKAAGNTDVTMRVFTDRNHLFLQDASGFPGGYVKLTSGKIDGEVMGALADWLVARLKP